jgi:hypothetical protein
MVSQDNPNIIIFISNGPSASFTVTSFPYPSEQIQCLNGVLADVNNDGMADLILPCKDLMTWHGDGSGGFGAPLTATNPVGRFVELTAADLNLDGYVDIVASTGYEMVTYINNQDGTFSQGSVKVLQWFGRGPLHTGDLNGDGYVDIIKTTDNSILVRYGAGDGTLGPEVAYPAGKIQDLALLDYNGDGRQDMIAVGTDQGLTFYPSSGCSL